MQPILWAAMGTGFTFLMTALGSALVFFFRKQASVRAQRICLGFAAGVMIAASIWSLLNPAIEEAEAAGGIGWIPAAGGFFAFRRAPRHRAPAVFALRVVWGVSE